MYVAVLLQADHYTGARLYTTECLWLYLYEFII